MRSITMSRVLLSGALALGAVAAIGGFTPGVETAEAAPSVSPFAGSWSGAWSIAERGVAGLYDWTISNSGRIEGTVGNATWDVGGDVVGQVHENGKIHFVGFAPNDVPGAGFAGFAFEGTAEIDGDGKLIVAALGLGENQSTRPSLVAVLERN